MATTAFDTALAAGSTTVTGYIASAFPVVAGVAVAFLGLKVGLRLIRGMAH
jgi:hypothetical protein